MPKFFLSIYADESGWADVSPEESKQIMDAYNAFTDEATKAGVMLAGEGLQPSPTSKTVHKETGTVSDGPFAETKEQFGGFYIVETKDIDEAVEWAKKIPSRTGGIEVREVLDYEALGG